MYVLFIFIFLSTLPNIESSQCSKNCSFQGLQLNSSFPSDICSISKSYDDTKQQCIVKLTIDFTTGLVNGSFNAENRSVLIDDRLTIETIFSLNDTSVIANIRYHCSVSDYCDIDFVSETLSSNWSAIQVQPIREKLVSRLYNQNNTDPIKCFSNNSCLQNESFCFVTYVYQQSSESSTVTGRCQHINNSLKVQWIQLYQPRGIGKSLIEGVTYYCNTPICGYNTTAIEIFQMLSHEYILPINLSVINVTTTPTPTKTSSSIATSKSTLITSTTISNDAPYLFVNFFNTLMSSFLITKYFSLL
ncbi:unnamed protein product [Rotaria sp. Silwood2]|nr:unnamed protein product [Rotaria sp. Silwood2]CAF4436214.1 unnamed protein product [Rotaria sp. Silwood2]CAF4526936.1 unnamed protein product [Rotaria sp. Silwood2]